MTDGSPTHLVCVGVIVAAHGIKGQVKIKSFTAEPEGLFYYSPITDSSGTVGFAITPCGVSGNSQLASIKGVTTREKAEALKGTKLYVERAVLPPPQDNEFYIEDLLGLTVKTTENEVFGRVTNVFNFGAGDLIAITHHKLKKEELFAFTQVTFPIVDLENKILIISPPEEIQEEDAT